MGRIERKKVEEIMREGDRGCVNEEKTYKKIYKGMNGGTKTDIVARINISKDKNEKKE